jgi:hypothetical protein
VIISGEYSIDDYEKVSLSSTRNLFYRRDGDDFPVAGTVYIVLGEIVEFKLTEYKYCVFDSRDNITPGKKDYVLSNTKRTTCPASVRIHILGLINRNLDMLH